MKWSWFRPSTWTLTFKAPTLVAALMFIASAIASHQVLTRLEVTQERSLQQLTSAYLDGLSSAVTPSVVRDDIWEIFDNLDRSRQQYRSLRVKWTIVTDEKSRVLAASDPVRFPSQDKLTMEISPLVLEGFPVIDQTTGTALFGRALIFQDKRIGSVLAEADVAPILKERRDVFWTLVATNVALTLTLAAVGYYLVRRMTHPVVLLTREIENGKQGSLQTIPERDIQKQSLEFRRLFIGYNELLKAVNEREVLAVQLAEEEKIASLGRLASGMAHEINNPLGGMFNALDSLKRHGAKVHVRATSVRLLENGLAGIRELVGSTLASYKSDQPLRDLTAADLDDLRLLIKPETKRRRLKLIWDIDVADSLRVPALQLRDAILNLLLNACHVSKEGGTVGLHAWQNTNDLLVEIQDSGPGLPDHIREYIERPDVGSVPLDRRSGLGLWIVKRLVVEMKATLHVVSTSEAGTVLLLVIVISERTTKDAA